MTNQKKPVKKAFLKEKRGNSGKLTCIILLKGGSARESRPTAISPRLSRERKPVNNRVKLLATAKKNTKIFAQGGKQLRSGPSRLAYQGGTGEGGKPSKVECVTKGEREEKKKNTPSEIKKGLRKKGQRRPPLGSA